MYYFRIQIKYGIEWGEAHNAGIAEEHTVEFAEGEVCLAFLTIK